MILRTRPASPYSIVCRQIPSECHRLPAIAATTGLVAGMRERHAVDSVSSATPGHQHPHVTGDLSLLTAERILQLPVRASNPHSGPANPHAASFNAASNRSRAERGEGFVMRDLFEASGIPR